MTTGPPDGNIISAPNHWCRLGMAQFGSALEWGSRGRKFESSYPDHKKASNLCRLLAFCFSRKNWLCVIRGMAQGNQKAPEFCRVCIRQYQKSTQKQALQGSNESANQKVRTLFLYMPLKLQSAHWFFLRIFCRMKAT